MNYILIDSKTRVPVPLPFHTICQGVGGKVACTIYNFSVPPRCPEGLLDLGDVGQVRPWRCGLELTTEADFMAERS